MAIGDFNSADDVRSGAGAAPALSIVPAQGCLPDCDDGSLVGPPERIRERFRAWEDCGLTGITVGGDDQAIELMAEITGASKGNRE